MPQLLPRLRHLIMRYQLALMQDMGIITGDHIPLLMFLYDLADADIKTTGTRGSDE